MKSKVIVSLVAAMALHVGFAQAEQSVLGVGETLKPGQAIASENGNYRLTLQESGNLAILDSRNNDVVWETGTQGKDMQVILQPDGAITLFDKAGGEVWRSLSQQQPVMALSIDDSGFFTYAAPNSGGERAVAWKSASEAKGQVTLRPVLADTSARLQPSAIFGTSKTMCSNTAVPNGYIITNVSKSSACGAYLYYTIEPVAENKVMCSAMGVPAGYVAGDIMPNRSGCGGYHGYTLKAVKEGVSMCSIHSVPLESYVVKNITPNGSNCAGYHRYILTAAVDNAQMCSIHSLPSHKIANRVVLNGYGCAGYHLYTLETPKTNTRMCAVSSVPPGFTVYGTLFSQAVCGGYNLYMIRK